jgi:hypothetical protein
MKKDNKENNSKEFLLRERRKKKILKKINREFQYQLNQVDYFAPPNL